MVTYSVRCSDQAAHDCSKTVEVDIGIPDLTPEQLAAIFDGGHAGVQAHQLEKADDAYRLQSDAMPGADRTYYVKVELDSTTCTACLKDRSTEIPEFVPVK
jgi:hypothetical protein